jgi:hypothetical protein
MNTSLLRENFTVFLTKRFPNDNNVSSTVSMAFFLDRHGDEFSISFEQVLSDGIVPDDYKQKLEEYFGTRGRKNPRNDSSVYAHSLRLLIEHMNGQTLMPATKAQPAPIQRNHNMRPEKSIVSPTESILAFYVDKWNTLSGYTEQENALDLLFNKTFPENTDLSEVMIKCSVLNDFYKTNIFGIFSMAKRIVSLKTDHLLKTGDERLVNDIATGHGIKSRTGKELQLLSFATKYCSRHNAIDYPIYDHYVVKILEYFRDKDRFFSFSNESIRDYHIFKKTVFSFREAYLLQSFTVKQIDQYLWQLGKEMFPITY